MPENSKPHPMTKLLTIVTVFVAAELYSAVGQWERFRSLIDVKAHLPILGIGAAVLALFVFEVSEARKA